MKKFTFFVSLMLLLPAFADSMEKPSSKEAAKVINYYHNGVGNGAILMECKLCVDVNSEEPDKNECGQVITNNKVNQGDEVFIWMNFLVPAGDEAAVLVGYTRNNVTRNTQHITLPGATRFRTWKRIPTNQVGEWTVNILQELGNGDLNLGGLSFTVLEAGGEKPVQ